MPKRLAPVLKSPNRRPSLVFPLSVPSLAISTRRRNLLLPLHLYLIDRAHGLACSLRSSLTRSRCLSQLASAGSAILVAAVRHGRRVSLHCGKAPLEQIPPPLLSF